ncbi:MAG TPA: glycyl-radical enzyme activating protein [Leptolinea sp.]
MKGLVFDLQRFSIHDGPGIRTVIFLKGCPLQCLWCCNPESQSMQPEVEFRSSLCQHCGDCITACPENAINPNILIEASIKIDREKCTLCGVCVQVCPNSALHISGEWVETTELVQQYLKDADIYRRSAGGVTLSGGEPLAQPEFSEQILSQLYDRNIHTAIETTGFAPWESLEALIPLTNLFLFDLKHFDSQKHTRLTGIPNEQILSNLERLVNSSAKIILRIPVIPGLNDEPENVAEMVELGKRLSLPEIHLMPFHQFGKDKYVRFGRAYSLENNKGVYEVPEYSKRLEEIRSTFIYHGFIVRIGG